MINIANLSKLLQSNNPEVVQGIINKIENLSESGGKTFEEVLQEVFSQLNSEKLEDADTKDLKSDKYSERSEGRKQKPEQLSQNKPQQSSEKVGISKQENLEYSAELIKKAEEENETENFSNLSVQSNQYEKTAEKIGTQKIEIRSTDKNVSKENGATQIIQQMYAQKVYKNDAVSKQSLNDSLSEKNIAFQDENMDAPEKLSQEIEEQKSSIQDKQISLTISKNHANAIKERTTVSSHTQDNKQKSEENILDDNGRNLISLGKSKTEEQLKNSENISQNKGIILKNVNNPENMNTNKEKITNDPYTQNNIAKPENKNLNENVKKALMFETTNEPKKEVKSQGVIKQDKFADSNNSEIAKKGQSTLSKLETVPVQKEKTIDKVNTQKVEVTIDKNNLKESVSTQHLQQSLTQKAFKNQETTVDQLSIKKPVNSEKDAKDTLSLEKTNEQFGKTNLTSEKTESTLTNKEVNLQKNNFKGDIIQYTPVKHQDSKNTNTVNIRQKSSNPDGSLHEPLNMSLPKDKNNQVKQNQGTYLNVSNIQKDSKNISENSNLYEYSKTPNKGTLNSQMKGSNSEKNSLDKDASKTNIQQKLDSSIKKTNNYPEKIFDSVSENKLKNTESSPMENIVSNVNKPNSINFKDNKEKQFSSDVKQDIKAPNNSYTGSLENISFIQQIVGVKQLGDNLNYLMTNLAKLEGLNSSREEFQKNPIINNKNSFKEQTSLINEIPNQETNQDNQDNRVTRNMLGILNEINFKLLSFDGVNVPNQIAGDENAILSQNGKLPEFVKEIRVLSDLNILKNYNLSENQVKKNDKTTTQNVDVKDKAVYQPQNVVAQNQLNQLNSLYKNEQNQQNGHLQKDFSEFSQNSYQKIYTDDNQSDLRKNTTEPSKNNLEVKSFQVEYKEKREVDSEKHNISSEDRPKISNKFIERLAELTYKNSEQKAEIQSNSQTGRYELAERLQASRNLEQIYEKIREFASLNKIEERVQMKLVPENLGNLDVEMKKEGKQLALLFVAENEKTKELIEKNVHVLRERLSFLDLDVRNIEVKVREEEKYYEHERNHQQPNQDGQNQSENKKKYTQEEVKQDDDERERNI